MTSFFKETFNKTKNMDGDFKNHLQTKKATGQRFKKFERFKERKLLQLQDTITKLGANL